MKTLPFFALLTLTACASGPDAAFRANPGQFGLYVASANLFMDLPVRVKRADSGEIFDLSVKHVGHGDTGYLVASLPPGRYQLESYTPAVGQTLPLVTANGYFDVQADCFNYGGRYDFALDTGAAAPYTNVSRIKDIELLPPKLRELAIGRDVCSAAMGQPSERIAYADIKDLLSL